MSNTQNITVHFTDDQPTVYSDIIGVVNQGNLESPQYPVIASPDESQFALDHDFTIYGVPDPFDPFVAGEANLTMVATINGVENQKLDLTFTLAINT